MNIEAGVYNNSKKHDWEKEKKKLKSLVRFHSFNKINNYNWRGIKGKKEKNPKESTEQVKTRIINISLESLLSESFLSLGVTVCFTSLGMPSNTVLISGPAVGTTHILICSYSSVFLPLMSTAIRTGVFSFVGALNDLLYIP